MSYLLDETEIKAPNSMQESKTTQYAQHRVLDGSIGRDYFGASKRVWKLDYVNLKKTQFDVLDAIYQAHLDSGESIDWEVTEENYSVDLTSVFVTMEVREFSVPGTSYLADVTLILTEV